MGIDCEFRAATVDLERVRAVPGVHEIYPPGPGLLQHRRLWTITTAVRYVCAGYATDERRVRVAAMVRALLECTTELWYGGDNAVPFVEVTPELVAEIEGL